MSDFRIVFIHGYTASSEADWYPQISRELKKLDVDFVIPDLPGDEHPHAADWLTTLHDAISTVDKPIILVGHSLGTRTALLYLEKYRPVVDKVFLIAAFANDASNARRNEGKTYPDFFEHTIDLSSIKSLAKKFIVMHSKDDDSIEYSQGVKIAEDLDAQLITYEGRMHFSDPENAPYVLKALREELTF